MNLRRPKLSLRAKLAALLLGVVAATAALSAWLTHALGSPILAWSLIVASALFPVLWLAGRVMRPIGIVVLRGTVL